ncbi:MAG: HU family DNA-binding protein [Alistipes senegalensis]|nr:HU family DNA-binding protein [Bacteroides cellulosilyticus]MCM1352895.1 HU family DNA-binding protein [Alistipes senegalensis]
MNKKELIRIISQEIELPVSQEKIALILDAVVKVVKRTLDSGESVKCTGFGTFAVKDIPPKRLYSPMKKEYILTESVRKIVFVEPRKQKPHSESISKLE